MSLSKYFKKSPDFIPESLFEQVGEEQFKKAPAKNSGKGIFQQQKIADSHVPEVVPKKPGHPQRTETEHAQKTGHPSPSTEHHATMTDSSQGAQNHFSPDPGKYIEIAIANEQKEQAYQKGKAEGEQKAEKELGDAVRALVNLFQQLDTVRETIINNSREELLEFALATAERILRISIAEQDQTIIKTLEEALKRAVRSDEFTVYLHPDDLAVAQEKSADLVAGISGLNNLVLRQDPLVGRGGAKIESENCTIDATVASQFEVIRDEISKQN